MCRLFAYLGKKAILGPVMLESRHSLLVQSYQPQEMTGGLLNADGFGVGWYHPRQDVEPFVYRQTLPMWNDVNFTEHLSRYIESTCMVANVRSATPGQAIQLSNCQPFRWGRWLGVHNGFIENFRDTLYRPMRDRLGDVCYTMVEGTTDSEHIFALFCNEMLANPQLSPVLVLRQTLQTVLTLAQAWRVRVALNLVLTDGTYLLAARCARPLPIPTLYWWQDAQKCQIASEPLDNSDQWQPLMESTLLLMGANSEPQFYNL